MAFLIEEVVDRGVTEPNFRKVFILRKRWEFLIENTDGDVAMGAVDINDHAYYTAVGSLGPGVEIRRNGRLPEEGYDQFLSDGGYVIVWTP